MTEISELTATAIAYAHREITSAQELLKKIDEGKKWNQEIDFRDVFNRRRRCLQLGIPNGEGGHRLLDVSFELGAYCIEAHIGKMKARIIELSQIAKMELDGIKGETS